jgi:hypothetical protein
MATKRYRRIEVGEYLIPNEAISLIEDMQTLDTILDLLGKIRGRSITPPTSNVEKANLEARQMLRRVGFLLSGMHSIATDNLRRHYLAGRRIKPRVGRQTLADVWQALMDGAENNLNEHKGEVSK